METHNITHHTCVKLYVITYNNIPIVRIQSENNTLLKMILQKKNMKPINL